MKPTRLVLLVALTTCLAASRAQAQSEGKFAIGGEYTVRMAGAEDVRGLAASLIAEGHRVLSHCGMGYNRSAFVAGLILIELGMPGDKAVARLRERRPGAPFNDRFADALASLGSGNSSVTT